MKLIIVGAGEVGSYLSAQLSEQGHDVIVIESNPKVAEQVDELYNVRVLNGNGSSATVLKEAGVDGCDYFLALTSDDKTNILSASLARALGAAHNICRIHDQTYAETTQLNYQHHFGIEHLINPEALCAVELAKSIRNPGRVAVENLARGHVEVQQVKVTDKSKLIDRPLFELKTKARIGFVQRGEVNTIATADTVLQPDDLVTIFGSPDAVYSTREKLEPGSGSSHMKVVLFGGGEISTALIRLLTNPRFAIRIIEGNPAACQSMAEKFPQVTVIQGDGTSLRLMEEEQVGNADYFVACTKDDENNIVTGLQAAKLGSQHVQAVINKSDYDEVLDSLKLALGVELIVSPRIVTANEIQRIISTERYHRLGELPSDGGIIIEAIINHDSEIAGKTVAESQLSKYGQIVAIQHKYESKMPAPNDKLLGGDRLVFITLEDRLKDLIKLLD